MNAIRRLSRAGKIVRSAFAIVLSAGVLVPAAAHAQQMGRLFLTAEAHVAVARAVHVGKVLEVMPIEYTKELVGAQKVGAPHLVVMEVAETLRGEPVKRLELVLALQSKEFLETTRLGGMPVMVTSGTNGLGSFPLPVVGIEEQGMPVTALYHFRVLDPVAVPEGGAGEAAVRQMNLYADEGRMFTNELAVVSGSAAVLGRMRAFAKKYPEPLKPVLLQVPREFGALVGNPEAYAGIMLPLCPESRATLEAVKKDPGIILRQIRVADAEKTREGILKEVEKSLAAWPEE